MCTLEAYTLQTGWGMFVEIVRLCDVEQRLVVSSSAQPGIRTSLSVAVCALVVLLLNMYVCVHLDPFLVRTSAGKDR